MKTRTQIWNFLNDSKTNEFLSSLIVKKYQKWDLFTNIFLVFATSSSIATWAIWKEMPLLWAMIIAISQIVTLAKPYFLFPKYIKVFYEKSIQWQNLSLEIEELWHKIDNSIIDEAEASQIYFVLRKRCLAFDKVPEDIIFFDYNKLQDKAEILCNYNIQKLYSHE
jgi:hypothetical protein